MMRLQQSYQESLQHLESEPKMRADIELVKEEQIPWREFVKRGWIRDLGTDVERVCELRTLYDAEALTDVGKKRHQTAFRVTERTKFAPWALAAWLQQGEWQTLARQWDATSPMAEEFDAARFRQSLAEIREFTLEIGFWEQMRSLCAAAGVHLELVPHLRSSGANGVSRWLEDGHPLIQLSLFRGWADVFWFTFFHEAAHVLEEHSKGEYVSLDRVSSDEAAERTADEFARDHLIPREHWDPYWLSLSKSRANILRLADEVGVHPGIVVGRLQHEKQIPYHSHNDLRVKFDYDNFGLEMA